MEDAVQWLFGTYPSWSHLIVRLALGGVFFAHGAQKLLGWFGGPGLAATSASFRQLGLPPAAATITGLVECLGGLAMIGGLLVRPTAAAFSGVMLVAIATVHARHGFFINWTLTPGRGHGWEFNFALLAMALSILVGGAGLLSVDRLIAPLGGVGD